MTLPEKLKNARISRKLSQKTLADTLGISRATLSLWEGGLSVPPVPYLCKYQDIFGFDKGYFDERKAPAKQAKNLTFDISELNQKGVLALESFYESLSSEKEYLKKS